MPWRFCITGSVVRGFLRDPLKAIHYARGITVDMKTLHRFNLHIHGKDFLRDFLEESAKLEMRPFLLWGTLLGCVREGQFLDHDSDLDMGVLARDYSKKDALIRGMLSRGYRLRFDYPYMFSFERKDRLLHLDVDLLYDFKGLLITSMPSERTGRITANQFPKEAFQELKPQLFLGDLETWIPGDPDKVLTAIYGDWRTPVKKYNYETDPSNQIPDPEALGIRPRVFMPGLIP